MDSISMTSPTVLALAATMLAVMPFSELKMDTDVYLGPEVG